MAQAQEPASFAERIDTIESTYEFMLAYAAQGRQDEADHAVSEVRAILTQGMQAIDGLAAAARKAVAGGHNSGPCEDFIAVLDADAGKSLAALRLVLSTRSISSQLVDNLNGSIHLRALLTDIFVLDEAMKSS